MARTKLYEFWTDDGDQNDIRATSLHDAAQKASKKISAAAWRDGAWGIVKGPEGQMDVPSRNPKGAGVRGATTWTPAQVRIVNGKVEVKVNPSTKFAKAARKRGLK